MRQRIVAAAAAVAVVLAGVPAGTALGSGVPGPDAAATATGENEPPLADAGLDQSVPRDAVVRLDATGSRDPDGSIVAYQWSITTPGGRTVSPDCATCPRTTFDANRTGEYAVTLTVTDDDGATATDTLYVTVTPGRPPSVEVTGPASARTDVVRTYTARLDQGAAPLDRVVWRLDGTVVASHSVPASAGTDSLDLAIPDAGEHRLTATVVDADGLRARASHAVRVSPGGCEGRLSAAITDVSPDSPIPYAPVTVEASPSAPGPGCSVASVDWTVEGTDPTSTTRTSATATWSIPGEYRVTYEVTAEDGSTARASRVVSVRRPRRPGGSGGSNFAVTIESTTSPVPAGDPVDVTATVENTGNSQGTQTVELTIDGRQVDSRSVSIDPGGSRQITLAWGTSTGDAGTHAARVASDDDADTAVVAVNDGDTGTGGDTTGPSPSVSVAVNDTTTAVGRPVAVTADVGYDGEGGVYLEWNDGDGAYTDGEVLFSVPQSVTRTQAWDSAGSYRVTARVTGPNGSTVTATTRTITVQRRGDGPQEGGSTVPEFGLAGDSEVSFVLDDDTGEVTATFPDPSRYNITPPAGRNRAAWKQDLLSWDGTFVWEVVDASGETLYQSRGRSLSIRDWQRFVDTQPSVTLFVRAVEDGDTVKQASMQIDFCRGTDLAHCKSGGKVEYPPPGVKVDCQDERIETGGSGTVCEPSYSRDWAWRQTGDWGWSSGGGIFTTFGENNEEARFKPTDTGWRNVEAASNFVLRDIFTADATEEHSSVKEVYVEDSSTGGGSGGNGDGGNDDPCSGPVVCRS